MQSPADKDWELEKQQSQQSELPHLVLDHDDHHHHPPHHTTRRPLRRTLSWWQRRILGPMPLYRSRIVIPLLAILITGFFFWSIDRYDRATLDKLTSPLNHLSSNKDNKDNNNNNNNHNQVQIPPPNKKLDQFCNVDGSILPYPPLNFAEWLVRKNYTRIYMRPNLVDSDASLPSLETIDKPVLQPFRTLERGLNVLREDPDDPSCPPVIDVNVAAQHSNEGTDKILFGMATTVERLNRQLPALLYSYAHTKTSLIVLVPGDTRDLGMHQTFFRDRGLDVTLYASPLGFTARYFGLVEVFVDHINKYRQHTQWVCWVDDDTFFLSLGRVTKRLSELDATKKHYIGALSEASWQVSMFGHIAYGGAGVIISKPLLDVLRTVYQQCQETGEQPGDQKLAQCIENFGDTELTMWDSLFQMDMRGAPDGVFESGRAIDTLHHWSSWYSKDVVKMSAVSAAAGRNSVLRRWKFDEKTEVAPDGREVRTFWVLTNGYSIVKYTIDGALPRDIVRFDAAEKTWDEDIAGYENRLGPLRPKDQPGVRKDRYYLLDSVVVGNNVHQLYTFEMVNAHSQIEVVWLPPGFSGDQNQSQKQRSSRKNDTKSST